MDNVFDVVRLVFLIKVPSSILFDPQTIWMSMGIGIAIFILAVFLVGELMGAFVLLVLVLIGIMIGGVNNYSLLAMWFLMSPVILVKEGVSYGAGLVIIARRRPTLILVIVGAITLLIFILYVSNSMAATLVYFTTMFVISSVDLYVHLPEETKRQSRLVAFIGTAFFMWIILAVSAVNNSDMSDGEKLALSIGHWYIGLWFLAGCIGGGWHRLRN